MHDHLEGTGTRGQPSNFGLSSSSDHGTFQVRGLPRQTHLDRIYLNGLHTLLPFWITNLTDADMTISMSDTLGGSVKFHTQNPNWDAVPGTVRETYVQVVAGEETTLVCSAATQKDFSEVFNQLNGTESVRVGAHETVEVVLLFLATQRTDATPAHSRRPSLGQVSNSAPSSVAEELVVARQTYGFQTSACVVWLRTDEDGYQVDLRASFCRSVLEMDPPTSRIYLDDCVIGRLYEREFRVRNASAIGLDWAMAAVEGTAPLATLQLVSGGQAEEVRGGHLGGYDSQQVVLRYTPEAAGEFLCRFLIENTNDAGNQRHWVFRARVSQRQKPRRIELMSAADINFGDCTSGVWYRREVVFRNVSDALVVMRFRVEGNVSRLAIRSAVRQAGETPVMETGEDPMRGALDDDSRLAGDDEVATMTTDEASHARPDELLSETGSGDLARSTPAASGSVSSLGGVARGDTGEASAEAKARRARAAALLDDVLIKPGAVRRVEFAVRGSPSGGINAGQFERQSFTLFCEHSVVSKADGDRSVERLSLPCTVNMCTSLVRVTPALLDFGPVDVGTLKSADLVVENLSLVAAVVQCQVDSKVVTCNRSPTTIPPLQSLRIRVDIYPRRVNARYRKQIVVRNLYNRRNDRVVEVRSEHVDRRRMAYHNLFYRTLVPEHEQNFVDFGTIPLNSRVLRRIALESCCCRPMKIQLAAGESPLVSLHAIAGPAHAAAVARALPVLERQAEIHSSIERFKQQAERQSVEQVREPPMQPRALPRDMFLDKRVENGHTCLAPFRRSRVRSPTDYLDVAGPRVVGHGPVVRMRRGMGPETAVSRVEIEPTSLIMARATKLLAEIESGLDMAPRTMFATPQAEDEYVRRQVDLQKYLDLLIESGFLTPAHTVTVPANGSASIFVMVRPLETLLEQTPEALRLDANVYMKLLDAPRSLLSTADLPEGMARLPERRFLVRASFCRSDLGLGQKSINVGNMQVDETSRKYLLIQNRSETPLMYAIRKTGSIASGDIQFVDNNRYGVVRGFDSRKIVFVFRPSLTGAYSEQISIANVLNAHGGKTATLKAVVRRPSKFYIQSLSLAFAGPLACNCRSPDHQALVLKNMTPKTRLLVVRPIDRDENRVRLAPVFPPDIAHAPPTRLLDRETEEKIEALEQKLKIAVRKNRPEKIDKYHKKLAKLRGANQPVMDAAERPDVATPEPTATVVRSDDDSRLVVTLPPNADVSIPVVVVPHVVDQESPGEKGLVTAQGFLVVHEQKDKDSIKVVALTAPVEVE